MRGRYGPRMDGVGWLGTAVVLSPVVGTVGLLVLVVVHLVRRAERGRDRGGHRDRP